MSKTKKNEPQKKHSSLLLSLKLLSMRLLLRTLSLLIPPLAVRFAAKLFASPVRIRHTPPERALLKKGNEGMLITEGGKMRLWHFGKPNRPAIVVGHGWGGRGAQFREFVEPLLSAGFQILMFDQLAHGHSDGRRSNIIEFAKGYAALSRYAKGRGIRIGGYLTHSFGAAGLAFAHSRLGLKIPRAVFIAPPSSLIGYSREFAGVLGISEKHRLAMQEHFEKRFGIRWQSIEVEVLVKHAKSPVLIIHDEEDREVPIQNGERISRLWKGARLHRTRGLGHRRILKDRAVIEKAKKFLSAKK